MLALVSAGLALLALVLTSVGVFGLLSYSVALRRHEMAIRRSRGATGRDVFGLRAVE